MIALVVSSHKIQLAPSLESLEYILLLPNKIQANEPVAAVGWTGTASRSS